jgi:hypothetical protein
MKFRVAAGSTWHRERSPKGSFDPELPRPQAVSPLGPYSLGVFAGTAGASWNSTAA